MTKYYMVADSQDYADEFDYPILSLFTDKELVEFKAAEEVAVENGLNLGEEHEIGFGTNEALEMTVRDMIDYVTSAQEITETEYKFVENNDFIGIDILDYALEILKDEI